MKKGLFLFNTGNWSNTTSGGETVLQLLLWLWGVISSGGKKNSTQYHPARQQLLTSSSNWNVYTHSFSRHKTSTIWQFYDEDKRQQNSNCCLFVYAVMPLDFLAVFSATPVPKWPFWKLGFSGENWTWVFEKPFSCWQLCLSSFNTKHLFSWQFWTFDPNFRFLRCLTKNIYLSVERYWVLNFENHEFF